MEKIPVAIVGATGIVGRFAAALLAEHPLFEVAYVSASPESAGRRYGDAVADKEPLPFALPRSLENMVLGNGDPEKVANACRLVFTAVSMDRERTIELENAYARKGLAVISNSSAHR